MSQATILVTGGLGYIGSHTTVALLQAGYRVLVIDNLANTSLAVLDRIEAITGTRPPFSPIDLQDMARVRQFFLESPPIHAVIHFAAHKSVPESVSNPLQYYQNNLVSLLNLLQVSRAHGKPPFVFSSSCSIYGEPPCLPVDESCPVVAVASPYANTKKISEEILRDVARAHPDQQTIALRYFNPVGAHASGLLGEDSGDAPGNLVPLILQKALGKRAEFCVFGTDYPTPDGSCVRDYIHIEDLAQAHVLATARLLAGKTASNYEVYNLGTGKGYSVLEVIATFERVTGEQLAYTRAPRRQGDISAIYANASLAERELGWKAEKNLEDMIKSAWIWERYKQQTAHA